jgi:hypothetical protein
LRSVPSTNIGTRGIEYKGIVFITSGKCYQTLFLYFGCRRAVFKLFQSFCNIFKSQSGRSGEEIGIFNYLNLLLGGQTFYYIKNIKVSPDLNSCFRKLSYGIYRHWFSPLRQCSFGRLYFFGQWVSQASLFRNLKVRLLLLTALLGWVFYAAFILEIVFVYRNYAYYGDYQYGFAQSVPYVNKLIKGGNFRSVVIDSPHGQPHIFYLFFSSYPPDVYQKEIAWRVTDYTARTNFNFGPYTFRDIYWPTDRYESNTLFVGDLSSLPTEQISSTPGAKILKDFYTPDGNLAVRVVEKD